MKRPIDLRIEINDKTFCHKNLIDIAVSNLDEFWKISNICAHYLLALLINDLELPRSDIRVGRISVSISIANIEKSIIIANGTIPITEEEVKAMLKDSGAIEKIEVIVLDYLLQISSRD